MPRNHQDQGHLVTAQAVARDSHVPSLLSHRFGALRALALLAAASLVLCSSVKAQGKLEATATTHSVTLNWTASTTTGVTYNVYRATSTAGPFTQTTGITASPYVDTSVTSGTTYFYQVTSFCGATGCPAGFFGESVPSNQISVTIPSAPAPPTGLSGTVAVNHIGSQDQIVATWFDAPGVSTFYALFNSTKNYVQMNGAPTPTAQGAYSVTYTGAPFNGNFAICDARNACLILPFVG